MSSGFPLTKPYRSLACWLFLLLLPEIISQVVFPPPQKSWCSGDVGSARTAATLAVSFVIFC